MKTTTIYICTVATLALSSTALAGDTIIDDAEDAIETAREFGNSECGKAVKGCWKTVTSAIKKTNSACKDFRKCKSKCRVAKRSDKKQCIASRCSSLKGKSLRQCKRSCRKGSRQVKKSCANKCGKRPTACKSAWKGLFNGVGKCVKEVKDADCKSWANKIKTAVGKIK